MQKDPSWPDIFTNFRFCQISGSLIMRRHSRKINLNTRNLYRYHLGLSWYSNKEHFNTSPRYTEARIGYFQPDASICYNQYEAVINYKKDISQNRTYQFYLWRGLLMLSFCECRVKNIYGDSLPLHYLFKVLYKLLII